MFGSTTAVIVTERDL